MTWNTPDEVVKPIACDIDSAWGVDCAYRNRQMAPGKGFLESSHAAVTTVRTQLGMSTG